MTFSRDLVVSPVYRHFWLQKMSRNMSNIKIPKKWFFQGILSFLLFQDILCIQKCLETGKRQNPLTFSYSTNFCTIWPSCVPQAQGEAWEVYPWKMYPPMWVVRSVALEVYHLDDLTRFSGPGPSTVKSLKARKLNSKCFNYKVGDQSARKLSGQQRGAVAEYLQVAFHSQFGFP